MKKYFISFAIVLTMIASPVFAQNLKDAFGGSNTSDVGPVQPNAPLDQVRTAAGYDPSTTFDSMIGKVILAILSLLGIIFLILLIYAGFLWMTASGNEQQVSKARSMIISAVIGLIIVLSAYSISYFVLSSLQEGTLT